jgi:DNA-binding transcriptional ArsR family regulator
MASSYERTMATSARFTLDLYKQGSNYGIVHALDILGDPVRRRILELLADGELSAGEIGDEVQREFGISQPAVSQHLRVLRESGFATVRPEGVRRLYAIAPEQLEAAAAWFDPFRRFWQPHLDALGTELARGRRRRRLAAEQATDAENDESDTTEPQEE